MQSLRILSVLAFSIFVVSSARAQEGKDEAVSIGEKHKDAEAEDVLTWTASAGGVLTTGNTENLTLNGGTVFSLIEGSHGLGFNGSVVYGLAGEDYRQQDSV